MTVDLENKENIFKSVCCSSNVSVVGKVTKFHVCNKCGKNCDIKYL